MNTRLALIVEGRDSLIAGLHQFVMAAHGQAEDLFIGDLSKRAAANQAFESQAGLVQSALHDKDLPTLARLWTEGEPVPWHDLHPPGRRRMALPTYPFDRRPFTAQRNTPQLNNETVD